MIPHWKLKLVMLIWLASKKKQENGIPSKEGSNLKEKEIKEKKLIKLVCIGLKIPIKLHKRPKAYTFV